MGISRGMGTRRWALVHSRMKAEGTMMVLRCIMPIVARQQKKKLG